MLWLRCNGEYAVSWLLVLLGILSGICFVRVGNDELALLCACFVGMGIFGIYHFDQVALERLERIHDELQRQRNQQHRTGT